MKGPSLLFEYQDRLVTRMGGWFPGERVVFRGQDLHADLKDMDWVELYVYGITGRRFTKAEIRILHAIWVFTSFPDPRLWNNRVAATAGSARSTGHLAISSAIAVSDASIYGGKPMIRAIDFLLRAKKKIGVGEKLDDLIHRELKECSKIYGYGRPITGVDERIPHLLKLVNEVGLPQGPHLELAFDIERFFIEDDRKPRMNYAGLMAALAADMGFTAREFYLFVVPTFVAGMLPCFIEAAENPEGCLFPLTCDRIAYEGPSRREWARP